VPSAPPTGDPLPRWLTIGDDPALVLPAFALVVSTETQPHQLTFLGTNSSVKAAQERAAALGVADRVQTGPIPESVETAAADHDFFIQLSGAGTDRPLAALAAGLPAVVARNAAVERALMVAVDLSVAEFVTPGDAAAAAAGYARLLVRQPDADWETLRALLTVRGSEGKPTRTTRALVVAVDDTASEALVPVLDALAGCGITTTVCTLLPGAAARLAATAPGLLPTLGPQLPSSLRRISASVPAQPTGGGRSARALAAALPSLAVGQLARLWVTRRPRDVASYVRSLVDSSGTDIVVVDEFVSAALTAIKPDLPFTASVTQRPRLWRHLAEVAATADAR
jgi:hypothetical protein